MCPNLMKTIHSQIPKIKKFQAQKREGNDTKRTTLDFLQTEKKTTP